MGKLWMPVKNFKKVSEDKDKATLRHPDGHEVTLAKSILSPQMRQQLDALPVHAPQKLARGGPVRPRRMATGGDPQMQQVDENDPNVQKMLHDQNILVEQQKLMDQSQAAQGAPTQRPDPGSATGPTNRPIPAPVQVKVQNPRAQGIPGIGGGKSAMGLLNQGMNEQLAGGRSIMNAEQAGAGQRIQADNAMARDLQKDVDGFWNGYQTPDGRQMPGFNARIKEIDAVKSDILSNNINPNHYFESGVFPKIVTAIGLLGAMSAKDAGAQILGFVNNQMDNDIKAQAMNKTNKMNVLNANLHLLGNMQDAMTMTRAQHMAVFSALLDKAAATTNSGVAKGNYQALSGQIHQNMANMVYEWTKQGVLGQPVGVGGTGSVGGQAGAQGTDASGAPSPQGPTDSVGNPLPQGMNINPNFYQEQNPVKLPGGGYGFAGDKESKGKAQNATTAHDELDSAIKGVQEAMGTGMAFNPAGADWGRKSAAVANLNRTIRNLGGAGKLLPQQQEALMELTKRLTGNPIPLLNSKGRQEQQLKDLGNLNNDSMNSTLQNTVQNYQAPVKPKSNKPYNEG